MLIIFFELIDCVGELDCVGDCTSCIGMPLAVGSGSGGGGGVAANAPIAASASARPPAKKFGERERYVFIEVLLVCSERDLGAGRNESASIRDQQAADDGGQSPADRVVTRFTNLTRSAGNRR